LVAGGDAAQGAEGGVAGAAAVEAEDEFVEINLAPGATAKTDGWSALSARKGCRLWAE
jgi:hypothetical protein